MIHYRINFYIKVLNSLSDRGASFLITGNERFGRGCGLRPENILNNLTL
ncbi:Uncharacterized protein dnm_057240 [Desulfonema magnum]|uniref:Uncharacterized protein n=1 Tax=Desulfonema magnum TaxID=45655 RepID=A0A975GQA0_9BACT|nr:Uncharacterized protein dnm_057240 [Desulfonema magnum]